MDHTKKKRSKKAVAREDKKKAEMQEIDDIEALIKSEVPAPGTNPLAEELRERDANETKTQSHATNFDELPISTKTKQGLAEAGYVKMTAIQRAAIPHGLAGRDILGAAKTGSGKTLAYLIPVIEHLWRNKWGPDDGLGALILAPTRELANQIFEDLRSVGRFHDSLSAGLVIGGGKNLREEVQGISRMTIIVSTPGRLMHHMDTTANFNCDNLQMLVLDEADRILDMGFKKQVNNILQNLPQERQTLLFSATQSNSVSQLARLSLNEPEYIAVHASSKFSTPTNLSQNYIVCPLEQKANFLWSFLRSHLMSKTMVFMSTQKEVRFFYEAFRPMKPGVSLMHMHGKMTQTKRLEVYWRFHDKETESNGACLFCTDVAARGLDFKNVDWVIQFDCPEDVDTYIHRVGRTARMNDNGAAVLVLLPSEVKMVESLTAHKIPIDEIQANPAQNQEITQKLTELCFKSAPHKILGQKAVRSYVRSYHLMTNKEIFDPSELPLEPYAQSLGLLHAPQLNPAEFKKVDKNRLIQKEKQRILAEQLEKAEDGMIPVKIKKKTTEEKKILKRKNMDVLSESALKLIQTDPMDEDEDLFTKKSDRQQKTHDATLDEFEKKPGQRRLKKQKVREFENAHHDFLNY